MGLALLQRAGSAGAKAALCVLAACASVPPPQQQQMGAARVKEEALVARGIDARRIDARGYGPAYPVASNDTPVGRQLNRRVQVVIATNLQ